MTIMKVGKGILWKRMTINWLYLPAIILNVGFIWYSSGVAEHTNYTWYISSAVEQAVGIDLLCGIQEAYILGITAYITPVLVSLPAVMRFYDEKEECVYRNQVIQKGRLGYAMKKILHAAGSGALVMALSLVLYTLIGTIYAILNSLPVLFTGGGFLGDEVNVTVYYRLVLDGYGWVAYLANCFALVAYGMIWPCIGTLVSVFVRNRKIALASPFLAKRLFEYLTPDGLMVLNTANLRLSNWTINQPAGGIPYIISYVCVVMLISIAVVYAGMVELLQRKG